MLDTTMRRYRDFVNACNRELQSRSGDTPPTLDEIVKKVLSGRAPHFYTGYETALHRVSRYLRDRNAPVSTLRHRMWRDMAERVAERRKKNPKLTISQAVIDVIDEEDAPSFYLSFFSGRRAYFRYKALRRSERGHRLGRRSLF